MMAYIICVVLCIVIRDLFVESEKKTTTKNISPLDGDIKHYIAIHIPKPINNKSVNNFTWDASRVRPREDAG